MIILEAVLGFLGELIFDVIIGSIIDGITIFIGSIIGVVSRTRRKIRASRARNSSRRSAQRR